MNISQSCSGGNESGSGQREVLIVGKEKSRFWCPAFKPDESPICVRGERLPEPHGEAIARYDAADVIEPFSAGLSPLGSIPEETKQTLVLNGYSANGLTSDASP